MPDDSLLLLKSKWKLFEVPATRFACFTSGSLRPKLGLALLCIVVICTICAVVVALQNTNPEMAQVEKLTDLKGDRTARMYTQVVKEKGQDENLVSSPFSLSSVMAMLYLGAGGVSRSQIREAMVFPEDEKTLLNGYGQAIRSMQDNDKFTLKTANRLYVQNGYELVKAFQDKTKEHFGAEAENVDFGQADQAAKVINDWVEGQTNSKIQNLISSDALDALTRLVLVNAVYFKGNWADKFDPKDTRKVTFHKSPTESVEVDMMHKTAEFNATFDQTIESHILEMPYEGDRLSMLFFLPKTAEGFAKMEDNFAKVNLTDLKMQQVEHQVTLPKFKITSSLKLNDALKALGATDMFDVNKADFSGLSPQNDLYVSAVLQKAFIEVNEEGTEAAAATAGIMKARMMPMIVPFTCDRPFMFVIRDKLTGMALFVGKIVDPSKE